MTTATGTSPNSNGLATSNGQAKRVVNYDPFAPVGNGLKGLLETMKGSIAQALPKHVTPERLIKTLLVAANRNPALLECTQASILETINRSAELGLDLSGTLGEAYPVPFNNKIKVPDGRGGTTDKWVKQCQLIIGYRGFEKLAWQSGEVAMIDAEVVYENDLFKFKKGFDPVLEWEPCRTGDRGQAVGAYACIITKNGGKMARFMPKADIERIRQAAQSKDSPAWRNHWDEMARKTVLRRVMKDAPLSTEKLVAAMEQDDRDHELANVLEASTQNLASLPAGRSSFRPEDQQQQETTDQGGGDQGGGVEGDVVDGGTARKAPDLDDETKKAVETIEGKREQAKGAKPDAKAEDGGDRKRWPMAEKDGPGAPGYWRAKLVAYAEKHLTDNPADAEKNTAEHMVQRLEDGFTTTVDRIPGPDVAKAAKAVAAVCDQYKKACELMCNGGPDVWAQYTE
jgi:recombination protein RecT